MLVDGQIAGGVAQGIGGALFEEFLYDARGEPLCVNFADYLMPTAREIPPIEVLITEDAPSPLNSLGVKGAGEGGANAAGAAIAAAIDDALGRPGAVTELPVTPQRLRNILAGRRSEPLITSFVLCRRRHHDLDRRVQIGLRRRQVEADAGNLRHERGLIGFRQAGQAAAGIRPHLALRVEELVDERNDVGRHLQRIVADDFLQVGRQSLDPFLAQDRDRADVGLTGFHDIFCRVDIVQASCIA